MTCVTCQLYLLGFFLLVSMCDDVAERLVVDVAGRVNGSEREGLIHLEIYKVTVCLVNIFILSNVFENL